MDQVNTAVNWNKSQSSQGDSASSYVVGLQSFVSCFRAPSAVAVFIVLLLFPVKKKVEEDA